MTLSKGLLVSAYFPGTAIDKGGARIAGSSRHLCDHNHIQGWNFGHGFWFSKILVAVEADGNAGAIVTQNRSCR